MQRALATLWLSVSVGCSFEAASLPTDGDAPLVFDGPAGSPDAASDSPVVEIDAGARPPDAPGKADAPGPCPTTPQVLTIGKPTGGTLSGSSRYAPTCDASGQSGPEAFYAIDLDYMPSSEIVVDVTEAGTLDTVLDLTATCAPAAGPFCASVGAPGAGEVVVFPRTVTGREYITVDSIGSSGGDFTIDAYARALVSLGSTCDPALQTSRCNAGNQCLDSDGNGAKCVESQPSFIIAGCSNRLQASDDVVVWGLYASASSVYTVEVRPPANGKLRAVVDDGAGGCALDTALDLFVRDTTETCATATHLVASDANGGLGPCPLLDNVSIDMGRTYYLKLQVPAGAPFSQNAPFRLVVDLH